MPSHLAEPRRISFERLPLPVQQRVLALLNHREQLGVRALPFGVVGAYAAGMGAFALPVLGATGLLGALGLSWERREFRGEFLQIQRQVRLHKRHSAIHSFLLSYPYFSVNHRGDLVGQRYNPRVWKFTLGRQRIISPFVSDKARRHWVASLMGARKRGFAERWKKGIFGRKH